MVWANIGAIGLGTGDVRDVDRVLGVYGAAQVATPQVLAALLRHAAERVVARLAEVNGEFTGELTARSRLVVHGTGRVSGTIRYGQLIVAEGGEVSGDVKPIEASEKHPEKADSSAATPFLWATARRGSG